MDDPDGFWRRKASDLGVDQMVEGYLAANVPEQVRAGLMQLLDALAAQGYAGAPQEAREAILRGVASFSPEAAIGVGALQDLVLFLYYGAPDASGQNPNWQTLGYPGPRSAPPNETKPIQPVVPTGSELALEADVCVVGSGAGGGVITGTLAMMGRKVVVIEAGGYYNEADFNQLELSAYQNLYYRGGPVTTADGTITMLSGACLGGGTTVNYMNCVRTTPWVREQWAREFGLEGLDTADFDRHLDAVFARISANDRCSELNGPHLRLKEGCQKLGYAFRQILRNVDETRYDPETAGYAPFGDQSGSRQSTTKTYLMDAYEHGAQIVVCCRADRVLVENGRAAGVQVTYADETGREARVTVRAPQVVVACGALESPALLLRSGIGGPAVGNYLRLHPVTIVIGMYDTDQQAWWGAPQQALCDQFANTGEGHGFLIEGVPFLPATLASGLPWTSGREHKEVLSKFRTAATFIAIVRDRGYGRVTLDDAGNAVHYYLITDELDLRHLRQGLAEQVRLHEAAGAREMYGLAAGLPRWKRGEDLNAFIQLLQQVPFVPAAAGGHRLFTAHELGSCRMGTDLNASVANPWGELHDVRGVWIGDGSAFPTATGTNPMITIMALARRTAEAIAASPGTGAQARAASRP